MDLSRASTTGTAIGLDEPPALSGHDGPERDRAVRRIINSSVWFGPGIRGSQERELLAFLGARRGVAVVQWPRDARHVELLSQMGLPRLLLVHPCDDELPADGLLQRALPISASHDDIHRGLEDLTRQAAERRATSGRPVVDGHGWVRVGDGCVQLPHVAQRIAAVLFEKFGLPVHHALLVGAAPDALTTHGAVQGQLARLSRVVNPLGLEVAPAGSHHHMMRWCAA